MNTVCARIHCAILFEGEVCNILWSARKVVLKQIPPELFNVQNLVVLVQF